MFRMKQKREVDADLVTKAKGRVDYPSMFIRKFTVPLSLWLARYTTIIPNHITVFSIFLMFVSLVLMGISGFTQYEYSLRLIGACLVFFTYILDHLDGKMARVLHIASLKGKWMDEISSFVYLPFIFLALAIGLKLNFPLAIVAMFAAVASPIHYLIIYCYKYGIEPRMVTKGVEIIKKDSPLKYLFGPVYMYILVVILCIINKPVYVFWFWAVTENLFWIGIAVLQFRAVQKWEKRE